MLSSLCIYYEMSEVAYFYVFINAMHPESELKIIFSNRFLITSNYVICILPSDMVYVYPLDLQENKGNTNA